MLSFETITQPPVPAMHKKPTAAEMLCQPGMSGAVPAMHKRPTTAELFTQPGMSGAVPAVRKRPTAVPRIGSRGEVDQSTHSRWFLVLC